MKCPRCGAENSLRMQWCYLCELSFDSLPEQGADFALHEHDPSLASDGTTLASTPGYPHVQANGLIPQPTGAPPPGYSTKAARSANRTKLIAIIIAMLVVLVAVGVILCLSIGGGLSFVVPAPPGFKVADKQLYGLTEHTFAAQGVVLDELFVNDDKDSMIVALHRDLPLSDAPSGDSPEELDEYFNEKKAEFADMPIQYYANNPVVEAFVDSYETVRLACGETALHMGVSLTAEPGYQSKAIDTLMIIKKDTVYEVRLEGPLSYSRDELLQFLMDNISF